MDNYVYKSYQSVRTQLLADIAPYTADYAFLITGHSLGGALASFCAFDLSISNIVDGTRITKYTFGEPRVGDPTWAHDYDTLVPNSYRVIHNADLVPHVPPSNLLIEQYLHGS